MRILRFFRPRSILSLILTGFILVLIPLVVALGVMAFHLDKLAKQGRIAVVQAVEATQGGRLLINQITSMERSARQYLVLRNEELLGVYEDTHREFQRTLRGLTLLNLDAEQRTVLNRLDEAEESLFRVFNALRTNSQGAGEQQDTEERTTTQSPREPDPAKIADAEEQVGKFVHVLELAREFSTHSSEWVNLEVAGLQRSAENATFMLTWLFVAVIPAVLIITGGFTALITRPLRHIARAIRRLGNEDFATPVVVHGPRDLEELGKRLDWLRSRLAELEEQKTRFLRHMSHELKTPLTDLREGVELLNDQVVGLLNEEQRQVTAILRENSFRLQKLIEDLLNFNQALSRNLEVNKEPVELADLVKKVIGAQRLAWKARNLSIIKELKSVRLMADREKLTTIVDNLLSNAIKFSPPGGKVWLTLKATDSTVQLEVWDSGPGFHSDDRERIFEAFYQGRTVAEGHVKGSGLGLAIACEYTAIHGGSLEIIEGEAPGGGIRLNLPN